MKRKIKVTPFRYSTPEEFHLGMFVNRIDKRRFEIALELATVIVGLKFRLGETLFDPTETTRYPEVELGTNLVMIDGTYRYGRAGEDLEKWTLVEADLAGRIVSPEDRPDWKIINELIWGNVKAAQRIDPGGMNVLGWPEVNVKKYRYCWLHQPHPGVEFKKESIADER